MKNAIFGSPEMHRKSIADYLSKRSWDHISLSFTVAVSRRSSIYDKQKSQSSDKEVNGEQINDRKEDHIRSESTNKNHLWLDFNIVQVINRKV